MVAAATLLNSKMTTPPTTTTSLINNNDWQQQQQQQQQQKQKQQHHKLQQQQHNNQEDICDDNNILKSLNLTSTKMKNNGDINGQHQQKQSNHNNNKNDIEEIDCNALLDSYDGETSNNSADWKSFRWTPESTRLMLRLRFERQIEFQLRNRQKKDLWAEIAIEMRKEGNFHTTGEVCDLKYRNMLQTYKKNYLKEERGMQSQIVWEYYELFKEAMKACAAGADELVPSQLCDTICENGDALLVGVKEEDDFNEDEDASDCVETSQINPKIVIDDETPMKNENNNVTPKRRAPSARVQANNNKRYRLGSSVSNLDTTGLATATASEFDWSQLPPLEPKPDAVVVATTSSTVNNTNNNVPQSQINATVVQSVPPLQNYSTAHNNNNNNGNNSNINNNNNSHLHNINNNNTNNHSNQSNRNSNYPLAPPWLTDSELREFFAFGESVGLQIAHVRDPRTRAFLQLKIQETLFLAKVGRLTE